MEACAEAIARWLSNGNDGIDGFAWETVDHYATAQVRRGLAEAVEGGRYSPATANKYLACLRGILRAAWRLGLISTDQHLRAVDVPAVRGTRVLAGREIPRAERQALMAGITGGSPAAVRDRALIAIAYLSGARRSELAALELSDVDHRCARVRVLGKGNKQRLIPLPPDALAWLEPWIALRGHEPGPLFCRIDRHHNLHRAQALSGEAIRQVLIRRARRAGISPPSPHDLRRTYAGDLLDAGADLPVVARLLGHASVQTTARYDRRGERAAEQAAHALRVS
jgi:site-specific recombinase XerD